MQNPYSENPLLLPFRKNGGSSMSSFDKCGSMDFKRS
jgi:hypothetical protein